ncbi:hypothetical protein NG54_17540 [Heyndrickxia ginsengihumi]|uniref:Uncharacterized protein n=1 Tax=Heyndrickxia ginsengihumi TaxID=363870 RepID=A0A0A6V968_9BACI|nr:hypothetical protein NG54_17540 [Heyndrickxia ginsengihumi]
MYYQIGGIIINVFVIPVAAQSGIPWTNVLVPRLSRFYAVSEISTKLSKAFIKASVVIIFFQTFLINDFIGS